MCQIYPLTDNCKRYLTYCYNEGPKPVEVRFVLFSLLGGADNGIVCGKRQPIDEERRGEGVCERMEVGGRSLLKVVRCWGCEELKKRIIDRRQTTFE